MARTSKEKNNFRYIVYDGEECVEIQTVGKYNYTAIVDKSAWDNYLSKHSWTVTLQGNRPSVKTSINKQSIFLWRYIIENEYSELDCWGTTIDHINNNPLDNRKSNLRIYNSTILNSTNVSSKFKDEGRQYIHKVKGGYKIHYNLAGQTFYLGSFNSKKYGGDEQALNAAKVYRDEFVIPDRQRVIREMEHKTRNIEFERGLRDKLKAGETEEIISILDKYGITINPDSLKIAEK